MTSFTANDPDSWVTPSPTFMTMRMSEIGGLSLLVAVGGGLLGLIDGPALASGIAGAAALVGLLWVVLERRRVRSWAYCERTEELMIRRGLLVQRLSVVPYGRMQFIDVTAGPAERIFKLATVQLHTAAAATDARIPGLAPQEAQRLRDRLAARGESRLSGL